MKLAKALRCGRSMTWAHQVHHQSAAWALRVRRSFAPCAIQPAGRCEGQGHSQLSSSRASCGNAFDSEQQRPVLLIDEIDKADIEFPNDLLARTRSDGVLRLRDATRPSRLRSAAGRLLSPRTTRKNCRMHSCAVVSSTTSSFQRNARRCRSHRRRAFSGCEDKICSKEAMEVFLRFARRCRA